MLEVEDNRAERFKRLSQLEVVDKILRGDIKKETRARRNDPDWRSSLPVPGEEDAGDQAIESKDAPLVRFTVAQLLNPTECAILSDRLLWEVHQFYTSSNVAIGSRGSELLRTTPQQRADGATSEPAESLVGEPIGLHALCKRVTLLADWEWNNRDLRLRVLFLRAWLTELIGDVSKARDYYEHYLKEIEKLSAGLGPKKDVLQAQLDFQVEPNLTLLALNNLAVLSLQTSGIKDFRPQFLKSIARLAIQRLLPAACLSLINFLDLAWQQRNVTGEDKCLEAIANSIFNEAHRLKKLVHGTAKAKAKTSEAEPHEVTMDAADKAAARSNAVAELPAKPNLRLVAAYNYWHKYALLVYRAKKEKDELAVRASEAQANSQNPDAEPAESATADARDWQQKLLKAEAGLDNAWRSFIKNALAIAHHAAAESQQGILSELQLWPTQTNLLFKAPPPLHQAIDSLRAVLARHARYAEAASILYPRDLDAGVRPSPTKDNAAAGKQKSAAPADLTSKVRELFESGQLDAARRLLKEERESL